MPLWLLQEYLLELGGQMSQEGQVIGDGWRATLAQMDDFQIGSVIVGQVRLEVHANEQAMQSLLPLLEKKLIRAGG